MLQSEFARNWYWATKWISGIRTTPTTGSYKKKPATILMVVAGCGLDSS